MIPGSFRIYSISKMFTLIVKKSHRCWLCEPHLPVFSCRLGRTTEHLADGSLVSLHYQIALLVFLFNDVVGLTMLLVALGVNFRGPLDKEGVEVVDPVNKRHHYVLLMAFLSLIAVALSFYFPWERKCNTFAILECLEHVATRRARQWSITRGLATLVIHEWSGPWMPVKIRRLSFEFTFLCHVGSFLK